MRTVMYYSVEYSAAWGGDLYFEFFHDPYKGDFPGVPNEPIPWKNLASQCSFSRLPLLVALLLLVALICMDTSLVNAQTSDVDACENWAKKRQGQSKLTDEEVTLLVNQHGVWLNNPNRDQFPPGGFTSENLEEQQLEGLDLRDVRFVNSNLRYALLDGSNLDAGILSGACLKEAHLVGTSLIRANLRSVDLTEAELGGAILFNADLRGANLTRAKLGPPGQSTKTKSTKINTSLVLPTANEKKESECERKLRTIESAMEATEEHFVRTDLRCTNLSGANLIGADLHRADLRGTDLHGANLSQADLTGADLRGAVLRGAILKEAVLTQAKIRNADFTESNLEFADLSEVDLSSVPFDLRPEGIPNVLKLKHADNHLYGLSFNDTPQSLKELQKKFFDAGMIEEERAVVAAIEHTRTEKLKKIKWSWEWMQGKLREYSFEKTSNYGRSRDLLMGNILMIWLGFALLYAYLIANNKNGQWGIRAGWLESAPPKIKEGVEDNVIGDSQRKMVPASPDCFWPNYRVSHKKHSVQGSWLSDLFSSLVGGMYASTLFTFLAVQIFPFGLSNLDLSKWIASTLNPRECEIYPAGWVKLTAFVQSMVSLYLIGLLLWLTWGRPFG